MFGFILRFYAETAIAYDPNRKKNPVGTVKEIKRSDLKINIDLENNVNGVKKIAFLTFKDFV